MKKQLDKDMLWRRLADHKRSGAKNGKGKSAMDRRFGGKKLSDMTPDERVEAMMKAGML